MNTQYDGHLIDSLIALVDRYLMPRPTCDYCGDVATKLHNGTDVCDYCYKTCREVDVMSWAEYHYGQDGV